MKPPVVIDSGTETPDAARIVAVFRFVENQFHSPNPLESKRPISHLYTLGTGTFADTILQYSAFSKHLAALAC